jgi:hypothetical protein
MLVLALEFSRGFAVRAHPTTNCGCSGAHGASGRRPQLQGSASPGGHLAAPSKRKSESPTSSAAPESVSDGLFPKREKAVRHPPVTDEAE